MCLDADYSAALSVAGASGASGAAGAASALASGVVAAASSSKNIEAWGKEVILKVTITHTVAYA